MACETGCRGYSPETYEILPLNRAAALARGQSTAVWAGRITPSGHTFGEPSEGRDRVHRKYAENASSALYVAPTVRSRFIPCQGISWVGSAPVFLLRAVEFEQSDNAAQRGRPDGQGPLMESQPRSRRRLSTRADREASVGGRDRPGGPGSVGAGEAPLTDGSPWLEPSGWCRVSSEAGAG
jgi:hypothetical protein